METVFSDKLPHRTKEHVTGDRAVRVFSVCCKNEWVLYEVKKDYGWDVLVTISEKEQVREDFFVQLKGHENPGYIEDEKFISEQFKVTTIRWLLQKSVPSMVCICDEGKEGEPIFYIWVEDAIKGIKEKNPDWEAQDNINLKIPVANIFDASSHNKIEEDVKKYHTRLKINKTIGEVIAPSTYGHLSQETITAYRDNPSQFVIEKVAPVLQEAGLIDIVDAEDTKTIKGLSAKDQELYKKLSEVSLFLNNFNDNEALKIFEPIKETEIGSASDGIKAKYYNCKGVLALRLKNDQEAKDDFEKAHKICPKEPKYETNYLSTQLHLLFKKNQTVLSEDIITKLDKVISNNPEFWLAIRVRAYWLGKTSSAEEAHAFLRNSPALEKEPLASHICLAEVYKDKGMMDEAIQILKQIEDKEILLDASYYSLYAFLLFTKALGGVNQREDITIHGAGPSTLNLTLLKDSCNYYEKAYSLISSKGFSKIFESTIVNYATILDLLGHHQKSEIVCRAYLDRHPESIGVNGTLAASLFKQGQYPVSLKYGIIAYSTDQSSTAFINLLVTYYLTESYEELLKIVSERISKGFHNKREEGIARTLAAISYRELGLLNKTEEQIKFLDNDEDLKIDAIIAKASITADRIKSLDIYRSGLSKHPGNQRLLSQFLGRLVPVNKENAEEVIKTTIKIKSNRQLAPDEYYEFGRAYLFHNMPEEAEIIFREGINRYPNEYRLLFEHASTLYKLGYEDESYEELQKYLKEGRKDYAVLKNMAMIARDTNRIDEAIKIFTLAFKKASNETEKGEIHCQLYELKRRRQYSPKELLGHIVEFGKTTNNIPELEARYLMLFMTSHGIPDTEIDTDVNEWTAEFRERLELFTKTYPKFPSFRRFSLPENVSDKEKAKDLLSTIASMSLPRELATASARIATRSGEWPLAFRANILYNHFSLYEYWTLCTKSDESQHAIHIWRLFNNLEEENRYAQEAHTICIDLSALLTLAEFDMLDLLLKIYDQIVISWGTKVSLENEKIGFKSPHPLAEKIYNWRIANKLKVRTRNALVEKDEDEQYKKSQSGIFLKTDESISKTIREGIGETLLLAQKLQTPLYSDESFIRNVAKNNYAVKAFSTLSLISLCKNKGILSLRDETRLFSQLINRNYKIIPFYPEHLNCRLKDILIEKRSLGIKYVKSESLVSDEILGSFLKQFTDISSQQILIDIAIDWWLSIIADSEIPNEQLDECMSYISFSFSMKSISSVLKQKIYKNEQEYRMAAILALFLWKTYIKDERLITKAWSGIKSCCNRYFQGKEDKILFDYLLGHFKNIIEEDNSLNVIQKTTALFKIPESFSSDEKNKFETYFAKNRPNFIR